MKIPGSKLQDEGSGLPGCACVLVWAWASAGGCVRTYGIHLRSWFRCSQLLGPG